MCLLFCFFFFFKQKTAYEMRISDWSSDVCSSDLHAALNSLLQSAGAVICKQWICDAEDALVAAGLKHGWDGDFVFLGFIHDEIQLGVRKGLEDKVSAILIDAARRAGDPFPSWRCPTDGDVKRAEERRVGKECVSTSQSRWTRYL